VTFEEVVVGVLGAGNALEEIMCNLVSREIALLPQRQE